MALEILYTGSGGETTRTLESILHLPTGNNDQPRNPALFEYFAPDEEYYKGYEDSEHWSYPPIFLVGNSIWYFRQIDAEPDIQIEYEEGVFS